MELKIEIIKTENIENFQKPIEVLSKRNSIENIVVQKRINSLNFINVHQMLTKFH